MAHAANYEYIPLGPVGVEPSVPEAGLYQPNQPIVRYQAKVRIERLVWYPLLLIVLYLLLSLWPRQPSRPIDSTDYIYFAGKSALASTFALPKLQYQFQDTDGGNFERREKVKGLIKETWDLYVQQAWGWDEVRPVSGGGRDSRYRLV